MSSSSPVLELSSSELETKTIDQKNLERACQIFSKEGFVVIKNVLDPKFVDELLQDYIKTNADYFHYGSSADALEVGDKRKMITVELKPPFNSIDLYANPFFFPIVNRLLGGNCILGSFGSVVSLPGSEMQQIHFDHPNLFRDYELAGIMARIPAFAITVVIPLVAITDETGPTRMWPGSHLLPRGLKQKLINEGATYDPLCERGDCILFDYRLLHAGMPNKSSQVRPILYSIYYRPWFRDAVNYAKQEPLLMSLENFRKVPDQYTHLFTWALDRSWTTTPQPTSPQSRNSPCECGSGLKYKHCHGKVS